MRWQLGSGWKDKDGRSREVDEIGCKREKNAEPVSPRVLVFLTRLWTQGRVSRVNAKYSTVYRSKTGLCCAKTTVVAVDGCRERFMYGNCSCWCDPDWKCHV